MSVYSSMYIGMSGMISNEHAITTIGDNIANMNTDTKARCSRTC